MRTKEDLCLLSEKGILDGHGEPYPNVPFRNVSVVAGAARQEQLAVIVDKREVWTLSSGKWHQTVATDIKLNCLCWTPEQRLLAGTENARIAWVSKGALEFIDSFDELPERNLWMTPWGGPPDVRSLAMSKDGIIFANVHVGWIVRSKDGGKAWENLRKGLEIDVHQVATHPTNPAIVFAATAEGFFISKNYGETFIHEKSGMPYYYQRACACFLEKDVYLVSTSRGPHDQADARLYRSVDSGKNWQLVKGLPDKIGKNINTYQIIITPDGGALTIVEDTFLFETKDWGKNWETAGNGYPKLYGALVVPGNR